MMGTMVSIPPSWAEDEQRKFFDQGHFDQQWLAIVIMITLGDYYSVAPEVLQISTTTKNSRPEN